MVVNKRIHFYSNFGYITEKVSRELTFFTSRSEVFSRSNRSELPLESRHGPLSQDGVQAMNVSPPITSVIRPLMAY